MNNLEEEENTKIWNVNGFFQEETFDFINKDSEEQTFRNISSKTFNNFDYYRSKKGVHLINHYDIYGEIIAQKFKYKDGTYRWDGKKEEAVPYGLAYLRQGGKRITIVNGEFDLLSVNQSFGTKNSVISINNGCENAKEDLKQHMSFINSFEEIVLWFNNTDEDRKAVKEVSSLFKPGKVKIITQTKHKDINELLRKNGESEVRNLFNNIKELTPDGIIVGSDLNFEEIISLDNNKSYLTEYSELNDKVRGLRKGELVTFTAGSGMGKTTMVREIAFDYLINQDLKIGWIALEENTQRSALGFMSLDINKPLHLEEERVDTEDEILKESFDKVINNDNVYFYDHFGSLDSDNLLNKLRYLAVGAEVDFIFLDHISIVISGGQYENERVAIDNLMTSLRSLAEETGVGIVIISHLKRPQGDKGFENGMEVTLSHLRGSGAIAQLSDSVIALERDQQSVDDNTIGNIRVLKNRYTGEVGLAGQVKYNIETGRLLEYVSGIKIDNSTEGFENEDSY